MGRASSRDPPPPTPRTSPPTPRAAGRTLSRPNSQARSRGVFLALLTRHGLDWCWRSISDWGQRGSRVRGLVWPAPRCQPRPQRPCGQAGALTYHFVVAVLGSQVQRDLPVQRRGVDGRRGPQQQPHGLQPALPGGVVQRAHACGREGLLRGGAWSGWGQGREPRRVWSHASGQGDRPDASDAGCTWAGSARGPPHPAHRVTP